MLHLTFSDNNMDEIRKKALELNYPSALTEFKLTLERNLDTF